MKTHISEKLGDDIFRKAYQTLQKANEKYELEELEQIFGEEEKIKEMFPFAEPTTIIRFLPLLFSLILMEN